MLNAEGVASGTRERSGNAQCSMFLNVTQKSQKFAEMVFNKNRENPSLRKILFQSI